MSSTVKLKGLDDDTKNAKDSENDGRVLKLLERMKVFAKYLIESSEREKGKSVLPDLEEIHSDIVSVQEGIEEGRLFKEGADLYSNWLELVFQSYADVAVQPAADVSESAAQKVVAVRGEDEKVEIKRLIALAYNNRGYLKYLQVDFEGAIKDYTKAISRNPSLSQAYYNRGLVTYRLAFFDQSVEDMTQAVKLDPSREEFQEGLTRVKEMLGSPRSHNFKL